MLEDEVLPWCRMLLKTSMPMRCWMASMMRWFAWCGTTRSRSWTARLFALADAIQAGHHRRTASVNTLPPFIWMKPPWRKGTDRLLPSSPLADSSGRSKRAVARSKWFSP